LLQQQAAVASLHARAATLIFAASFASSLLGARALDDGVGAWDWIALGLLVAIGCLAVFLLWPYYNLTFRFDPEVLLARYVDVAEPPALALIHRELAIQIKADWQANGRIVRRLREALQIALILPVGLDLNGELAVDRLFSASFPAASPSPTKTFTGVGTLATLYSA
jgi:hypothetical protein